MRKTEVSSKVKAMYQAVGAYVLEGADLNKLTVSDITNRAGIGKGTAYEYFHTKEEIIVNAVLYFEACVIEEILAKLETCTTFAEKFCGLLSCLENEISVRDYFMKYVHLVSGSGELSSMLKEAEEKECKEKHDPMCVIHSLTEFGLQNQTLRDDLPREYLDIAVASKVLIYIFQLNYRQLHSSFTQERIKRLLYEGLEREIGIVR